MRKLLFLLLVVLLPVSVHAGDLGQLIEWIKNSPDSYELRLDDLFGVQRYAVLITKEEDISKHDFKWRWDEHNIGIHRYQTPNESWYGTALYVSVSQYQELVTPGRAVVTISLVDYDADGKVDNTWRDFNILVPAGDDAWMVISPRYPDGFRDMRWYDPSMEDAQELYEHELDFWFKEMGLQGGKTRP